MDFHIKTLKVAVIAWQQVFSTEIRWKYFGDNNEPGVAFHETGATKCKSKRETLLIQFA